MYFLSQSAQRREHEIWYGFRLAQRALGSLPIGFCNSKSIELIWCICFLPLTGQYFSYITDFELNRIGILEDSYRSSILWSLCKYLIKLPIWKHHAFQEISTLNERQVITVTRYMPQDRHAVEITTTVDKPRIN